MKTYNEIKDNPTALKNLTGNEKPEIEALSPFFEAEVDAYFAKKNLDGTKRKQGGLYRENSRFKCSNDMLLFFLMYLKLYPTQHVLAAQNGMSQPQVHKWLKLLKTFLTKALKKMKVAPSRVGSELKDVLKEEKIIFLDATERPICRPKNYSRQKKNYSGKKNAIRIKIQ